MRPSHVTALLVVALGGAVGTAVYLGGRRAPTGASVEAPGQEVATPGSSAAEIARLRAEVAGLRAAVDLKSRPAAATDGTSRAAPTAEHLAQAQERRRAYLDGVETSFRQEAVDPRWSADSTGALRTAFAATDVGLEPTSVDCRSQTCRIDLPEDGRADHQQRIARLAMNLVGKLPYMVVDHGAGPSESAKTVVYFLRQGPPVSKEARARE